MANSILADFRAKLVSDLVLFALVNGRIAELPVQDDEPAPWIGFRRLGEETELDLSGAAGVTTTQLEVKARATSPESADEIRRQIVSLRGFRGTFGDHAFLCTDVFDADNQEDESHPPGSDDMKSTVNFRVEIIHRGD